MSQGLQVWDAEGVLVWDVSTRGGTVLGFIGPISNTGQHTDSRLAGKPGFCFVLSLTSVNNPAVAIIDGTTVKWAYPVGLRDTCKVVYGVY